MKAYTYISKGRFEMKEQPVPQIVSPKDAIVRVFDDKDRMTKMTFKEPGVEYVYEFSY